MLFFQQLWHLVNAFCRQVLDDRFFVHIAEHGQLTDDYGLDYYAAFVGCSAETEASFETVVFLSKKVDELGLNSVLKIESGDGKIARTIVQNTKNKTAKVLTLDSIQSTTLKQANAGTTYLKIMEGNLKVLKEALK